MVLAITEQRLFVPDTESHVVAVALGSLILFNAHIVLFAFLGLVLLLPLFVVLALHSLHACMRLFASYAPRHFLPFTAMFNLLPQVLFRCMVRLGAGFRCLRPLAFVEPFPSHPSPDPTRKEAAEQSVDKLRPCASSSSWVPGDTIVDEVPQSWIFQSSCNSLLVCEP